MENKDALFRELLNRRVWIPCVRDENGTVIMQLLVNHKEEQYVPAFYGKESKLGNFREETLIPMDFLLLRHTLIDLPRQICGVVIEPFGENILMDRNLLKDFDLQTKGMSAVRQEHGGRIALMIPERLPDGLKTEVERFFEKEKGVKNAWILLAKREREKDFHLLFAVESDVNRIRLFPALADVIRPFMKPGQQFELTEKSPMIDEVRFRKAKVYSRN